MSIVAYYNIPDSEIVASRTTTEGKVYTLNHPDELVVNMRYKGVNNSSANSQGWERNSVYYFRHLKDIHPEYFSKKNSIRIENGESPLVDQRFVEYFPQYHGYENETLVHHHIGKDGQAVAVPQSIHKGSGEIHIIENELGITENAKQFSLECHNLKEAEQSFVGKTADVFYSHISGKNRENEVKDHKLVRRKLITPEILASRRKDTEAVLSDYRENLKDLGVSDEQIISDFLETEREKIDAEYSSLDRGDEYPDMYVTPTNWSEIAKELKQREKANSRNEKTITSSEHVKNAFALDDKNTDNYSVVRKNTVNAFSVSDHSHNLSDSHHETQINHTNTREKNKH